MDDAMAAVRDSASAFAFFISLSSCEWSMCKSLERIVDSDFLKSSCPFLTA
jgi:hypothetical protein